LRIFPPHGRDQETATEIAKNDPGSVFLRDNLRTAKLSAADITSSVWQATSAPDHAELSRHAAARHHPANGPEPEASDLGLRNRLFLFSPPIQRRSCHTQHGDIVEVRGLIHTLDMSVAALNLLNGHGRAAA